MVERRDWREGCFFKLGMGRALNRVGRGLVVVLECRSSVPVDDGERDCDDRGSRCSPNDLGTMVRRRGTVDWTSGAVFLGRGRARKWFEGDVRLVGVVRSLNGFGTVTRRCRLAAVGDRCLWFGKDCAS